MSKNVWYQRIDFHMSWCLSLLLKRENFRVPTRNKTVEIEDRTRSLKPLVAGPWRTVKEPCPDGSQAWEMQVWNEPIPRWDPGG